MNRSDVTGKEISELGSVSKRSQEHVEHKSVLVFVAVCMNLSGYIQYKLNGYKTDKETLTVIKGKVALKTPVFSQANQSRCVTIQAFVTACSGLTAR